MSGRATFEQIKPLLAWRDESTGGTFSDVQLVEALSVEGLPYEQTPPEHEPALKAFRTNQARRLRLVRRYLAEKEQR
jgi:hypothetical protein